MIRDDNADQCNRDQDPEQRVDAGHQRPDGRLGLREDVLRDLRPGRADVRCPRGPAITEGATQLTITC